MKISKAMIFFLTMLFAVGCSDDLRFSEVKTVPDGLWHVDSVFTYEVSITAQDMEGIDTLITSIMVRHNEMYEYQNLWMFVECTLPDSTVVNDTVNMMLADNFGRWVGNSGIGSLYTVEVPMTKQLIREAGDYEFKIIHGMRLENLESVEDVGVNVYKFENINGKE